jgi:outer membrane protein OmpA-like peptidoglycan-associated protein
MKMREMDLSLPAVQKHSEPAVKSDRHGAGELDRAAAEVSFGSSLGQDRMAVGALSMRRPNSTVAPQHILWSQRQYGNQYVLRMLGISKSVADRGEFESDIEERIEHKRSRGHPLPDAERAHFGQAFGTDLDGVRVHTDSEADALNGELNAAAFTTGQDVFFSQGSYEPNTSKGRRLLGHELTHVVQQGGSRAQGKLRLGEPGDVLEKEAEEVGDKLTGAKPVSSSVAGERPSVHGMDRSSRIQRDVVSIPPNPANPAAPTYVFFNAQVQVFEDGVMKYSKVLLTGGNNWSLDYTISDTARKVKLYTSIFGNTSTEGSFYTAAASTDFEVRADGSIRNVTDTRPMFQATGLIGGTFTADKGSMTAAKNSLTSTIGVIFESNTSVAAAKGNQSSVATTTGTTKTTTVGSSETTGGEVSASELGLGGKVTDSSSTNESTATAKQESTTTTTGQNNQTTTNRPGTQNTISGSVTMTVNSPSHAARGNHLDLPNFAIGSAVLPPGAAGAIQQFLATGGPGANSNLIRLLQQGGAKVHVEGYASMSGSAEHNSKLARDRALAVQTMIQKNLQINQSAFTSPEVYGQARPEKPQVAGPEMLEDPMWRKAVIVVDIHED